MSDLHRLLVLKPFLGVSSTVPVTQAEYDAMVEAGTISENTFYFIKEEPL